MMFELSEDEEIEFTTAGILEAIGRLPLVTHPLARPKGLALPVPPGPFLHLPDDIVAVPGPTGVVITGVAARTRAPEARAAVALATRAGDMRRMRDLLTYATGAAVRLDNDTARRIVGVPGSIRPDFPFPVPRRTSPIDLPKPPSNTTGVPLPPSSSK